MSHLKIIFTLLVGLSLIIPKSVISQSIERFVIGSSGTNVTSGGLSISFTTGEAVVFTASSGGFDLTQGFQQPSIVAVNNDSLRIKDTVINASCQRADDGYCVITMLDGTAPFTIRWGTPIPEVNVTTGVSDTSQRLTPGVYDVTITDANGRVGFLSFEIKVNNAECVLVFYSGITPNGDGNNDLLVIDGIEYFPKNELRVYNRWGELVWTGIDYNNKDVAWNGQNRRGQPLPDGTYYYLVSIPGQDLIKKWIELIR